MEKNIFNYEDFETITLKFVRRSICAFRRDCGMIYNA